MAFSNLGATAGKKHPGAIALATYLLLSDIGPEGAYPGSEEIADILCVRKNSVWKAEQVLVASGLVKFSTGTRRRYEITAPPAPTPKQLAGIRALLDAQDRERPIVAPTPEVEQVADAVQPPEPAAPALASEPLPEVVTVPQAAPPAAKEETPDVKIRTTKLTPEAIAWFTEKPENMDLYLRFGSGACGRTRADCETNLRSQPTDWLAFKPPDEMYPQHRDWKITHHMGYYWHGACLWRARNGINLTMPQMGRLAGTVGGLLKAMTPDQTHLYMFNAIHCFELVQFRIGKLGETMILDEATLAHSLVRTELQHMNSHGNIWVQAEFDRMNDAKQKNLEHKGKLTHGQG